MTSLTASCVLLSNATILTMNDALDIVEGTVSVREGGSPRSARIRPISRSASSTPAARICFPASSRRTSICARRCFAAPPTICRCSTGCGAASGRSKRRTRRRRSRLGAAGRGELLLCGTTTALTMETVHDTDVVFEALEAMGLRAVVGKCMMDAAGEVPGRLQEETRPRSTRASRSARAGTARAKTACAPRSHRALPSPVRASCSKQSRLSPADEHCWSTRMHRKIAPKSKSSAGCQAVGRTSSTWPDTGLATRQLCVAHCVWVTDDEQSLMAERGVKVMHCPGSNLKLGSGIAPVPEMRAKESAYRSVGTVPPATIASTCSTRCGSRQRCRQSAADRGRSRRDVVWMATREGAKAWASRIRSDSIETGKRADLILIDLNAPHLPGRPGSVVHDRRCSSRL